MASSCYLLYLGIVSDDHVWRLASGQLITIIIKAILLASYSKKLG